MKSFLDAIVGRILPALLTASGVVLVAAGLLSYADPNTAGAAGLGPTTGVIETFDSSHEAAASPSPSTSGAPGPSGDASSSAPAGPTGTPPASLGPPINPQRAVATRVIIPAMDIDLPIVKGSDGYPYCGVAMYLQTASAASEDAFGQPGEGRATYLYAHARDGMFGQIYDYAMVMRNPGKMKGMTVWVYTSDFKLYLYEIHDYHLHAVGPPALDEARGASKEQLWLQTSEGPKGTPGKTQLIAYPISPPTAASPKDAVPRANPERCG